MKYLLTLFCLFLAVLSFSQDTVPQSGLKVKYEIHVRQEQAPISPYIYGTNGQSHDRDENIASRRLGGARMTAYNWENNASHAGRNWRNYNDSYLTDEAQLSPHLAYEPGIVLTNFHDTSLSMNCYSLLTLQMAGYVARDKYGPVSEREIAPSSRWSEVKFEKQGNYLLKPDPSDKYVYMDELVNFLVSRYGKSSSPTGIKGYALDNEPELWSSIHPRLHPKETKCYELLDKSIRLSSIVKLIDPSAEVFGPSLYGYTAFVDLVHAPDWSTYMEKGYETFIDAYLGEMKKASDSAGTRLVDVLSLHWYPEAKGKNDQGEYVRVVYFGGSERGVAEARMQAPRTLWDSTYKEESYIGKWHSPLMLIPRIQQSIQKHNKGTKLAIVEYDYGGMNHISGGIAVADVLGIYGKYGLYMSNYWGPVNDYISSAFKIYRNYDGWNSAFGNIKVMSIASDTENSSVYSSLNKSKNELHLIVINKNYDHVIEGSFHLAGEKYNKGRVWGFDSNSTLVTERKKIDEIKNNEFTYSIPPLTVLHFVLKVHKDERKKN